MDPNLFAMFAQGITGLSYRDAMNLTADKLVGKLRENTPMSNFHRLFPRLLGFDLESAQFRVKIDNLFADVSDAYAKLATVCDSAIEAKKAGRSFDSHLPSKDSLADLSRVFGELSTHIDASERKLLQQAYGLMNMAMLCIYEGDLDNAEKALDAAGQTLLLAKARAYVGVVAG